MRKQWIKLSIALVVALMAAVIMRSYIRGLNPTIPVLVAARLIAPNQAIAAADVREVQLTRSDFNALGASAYQTPTEIVGAVAAVAIAPGEILLHNPERILLRDEVGALPPGQSMRVVYQLKPTQRAVGVAMDPAGAVFDNIKSGDLVDVFMTTQSKDADKAFTSMVLQHVAVLQVLPATDPREPRQVVLLTNVDQAARLNLSKRMGTIDLALSPPNAVVSTQAPVHGDDLQSIMVPVLAKEVNGGAPADGRASKP